MMLLLPMYRFPTRRGWPSLMNMAIRELDELSEMSFESASCVSREPGYSYRCDENAVNIRVELPGVAPADLEVHTEVGKVVVKGKRFSKNVNRTAEQMKSEPKEVEADEGMVKDGEKSGNVQKDGDGEVKQEATPEVVFVKELHVSQWADTDATRALFKDGLLELWIPKKEQQKTRQIKVDVSA